MNKLIKNKILLFLITISISQLAGVIGSFFTIQSIPTWYADLVKPSFNPPNWIFGPVWFILYTLMGTSLFLVVEKTKNFKSKPVLLFLIHLAVNSLWSIVFFGLKLTGFAFFVIILLWLMIFYLIINFRKINKVASYLLYPYLAWVTFASLLNFSIWLLNR